MEHDKYREWISRDLDKDLNTEEKQELYKHLETCDTCQTYQEDLQKIATGLSQVPTLSLDPSVSENIKKTIHGEKRKTFVHRRWLPYAAILLVAFVLISPLMSRFLVSEFSRSGDSVSDEGYYPENNNSGGVDGGVVSPGKGAVAPETAAEGQKDFDPTKIIYTGNISLYTEDLKRTMEEITSYTAKLGGFIQQSNVDFSKRYEDSGSQTGYMLLRIKSADFDKVMKDLQGYGDVINTNINTTNITQQYQDIQGELDSYLIQQERLLDYLKEAKSITDMLTIEEQLTRVRNEINSRSSLIKNWDTQVAYSTVQLQLVERTVGISKVNSPFADFAVRIKNAFVKSINYLLMSVSNLIVALIAILPFVLVLGILGGIGLLVWKKRKK